MTTVGALAAAGADDLAPVEATRDGLFRSGRDGVRRVRRSRDGRVDLVELGERTLARVHAAAGPAAYYPLEPDVFEPPAEAVLMDLDGTSVHSERFWIWIVERAIAALCGDPGFAFSAKDGPHVSGHSVSEHLQYAIDRYCPGRSLEAARRHYHEITARELDAIARGGGRVDAFEPAPGLREFLLELKGRGVRIALVTSGLREKAWPEIAAVFRTLKLGDPLDLYDTIVTAGERLGKGRLGTLGELAPKPHPWLYAEAAHVGLGVERGRRERVIGLEDSGAGVFSLRLAGFAAIGVEGGNIAASGARPLLRASCGSLPEALPLLLGR